MCSLRPASISTKGKNMKAIVQTEPKTAAERTDYLGHCEPEGTLARTGRGRNRRWHGDHGRKPGVPGHPRRAAGGVQRRQGRETPRRSDRTSRWHGPPDHLHARREAVRRAGRRFRSAAHVRSSARSSRASRRRPRSGSSWCTSTASTRRWRSGTRSRRSASSRIPRIRRSPGDPQAVGVRTGW